jgi:hypothetical protein
MRHEVESSPNYHWSSLEFGETFRTSPSPEGRGCREAAGEGYRKGNSLPITWPFGPPSPFRRRQYTWRTGTQDSPPGTGGDDERQRVGVVDQIQLRIFIRDLIYHPGLRPPLLFQEGSLASPSVKYIDAPSGEGFVRNVSPNFKLDHLLLSFPDRSARDLGGTTDPRPNPPVLEGRTAYRDLTVPTPRDVR